MYPQTSIDIEAVMEIDREYFINNSGSKQYTRSIHPLEILEAQSNGRNFDSNILVTVTEVELGHRMRSFNFPKMSPKKKPYKGFGKPR